MSNSNDNAASDEAPADPGDQLIQWAIAKFGDLTKAEGKMLKAAAAGDEADLSSDIEEENDPGSASSWPEDRSIRAKLLAIKLDPGPQTPPDFVEFDHGSATHLSKSWPGLRGLGTP